MTNLYSISGSALLAQRQRLNLIASNMANADSATTVNGLPYRARLPVFAAQPLAGANGQPAGAAGVRVAGVVASNAPFKQVYEPGNPLANTRGYVLESNVSMVQQMTDMIDATKSYRANLSILLQAQQLNLAMIKAM